MLHGSVYQMTRIYEQFGQSFCKYLRYHKNDLAGKVLICPPSASHSPMVEKIPRKRVAMISGWAVDPNSVYRYQVDAAFPLSDHADYSDLGRYVDLVQPRRVLTLHGFAAEFARDLRERGIEAWALSEENQMELGLTRFPGTPLPAVGKGFAPSRTSFRPDGESPSRTGPDTRDSSSPGSEFAEFARVGQTIGETPAKLEKVRL